MTAPESKPGAAPETFGGNASIQSDAWPTIVGEARTVSDALPDLLVAASHIAASITSGWHGRRRAGPGESFWQFRPFNMGEPAKRIDWRRSARDDHLYVREREWEAAHTVWLWADLSASMAYRSRLAPSSKRDRALILLLALAELLAYSGERIGLPGITRPFSDRQAAERLADSLAHMSSAEPFPDTTGVKRFSDVVLFADLLDPADDLRSWVASVASTGARGHIVQILDPIEETFPFGGRVEFNDPESGMKLTAGRAESWRAAYQDRLERHKAEIRDIARKAGWTYTLHHTDQSASTPLLVLHAALSTSQEALGFGGVV
ncbi:DUF58 domain-containing protein [Roseibium limicola]|uniref:DUF58 domain-containing protein n=1 Tax=Roseibium limicola TaxID=2816037 RepID=A0A939EL89_9HYPH|nr:DUF58 domain-containing protein [Roseibium limicola]MBO0343877.1 DUF58 domain-containing protein [Roseibium limicola]